MTDRVKDKIILVTGAARGIGAAVARLLIQEGATVIITDVLNDVGGALAEKLGERAHYCSLDVSQEDAWKKTMDRLTQNFGGLDVLVNNAGITGLNGHGPQDPEHASLESWHYVHAVNLDGVFLGCKYAIPLMKHRGNASIINMSSRSGVVGVPNMAAYASSKAAIRNHTKTVALYCAQKNYDIRCNSIHPAAILTPIWDPMIGREDESTRIHNIQKLAEQIPLKRMGMPMDIAQAVLFLASDESLFITGSELTIDGGILAGSAAAPGPSANRQSNPSR